jgi:carboxymethylenebutenolidase
MRDADRVETITAPDGQAFDAWVWLPASGSGPGILLLQEIFGVGPFLEAKASDLADLGYVVACPDVFWRTERHVAHDHDDAGLQAAFGSMTRWQAEVPEETTSADLLAALDHLRGMPEVGEKVAVMGYCLGGRLAYELAAAGDPDVCVSYYGSGIGGRLDDTASSVACTTLFHYGGADPYIPAEEAEAVARAFAGRDDVELHVHEGAGHAFENSEAGQFFSSDAAERSWELTTEFLARTLG